MDGGVETRKEVGIVSPRRRTLGKSTAPVKRVLVRPWEAALALSVSETKIYDLMMAGKVPYTLVGGSRRVPVAWLEKQGMWPPEDE